MEADRLRMSMENVLEVLQPVPYGGAFAKVHAWNPSLFGQRHEKVVLLDGDVLAKGSLSELVGYEPLSAARDLMDAFNYGVIVLRPDEAIHKALVKLLSTATREDIAKYNLRGAHDSGFCDQTLVAGYLTAHHGPIHFFDDRYVNFSHDSEQLLLSTKYNLVVSYRAYERCEDERGRRHVDAACLVHFANNWLHFEVLSRDRNALGRIDGPRCYAGAFRYWHDVHAHAMASVNLTKSRPALTKTGDASILLPTYEPLSVDSVSPAQVQVVFEAFRRSGPVGARLDFTADEDDEEL
eukprot:TRINITY_DN33001_c0_g1_i1.p1 TRINITY_DN33001_c0_g1~~TRINITY_DN33001_c0_g1_i1.p1  ORF type:complete len:335 (+),score=40.33 TRINITY_DN33001_c0_g1_i1:123-1007(+)